VHGRGMISISPKGITAVVIEGLKPRVEFQDKFHSAPVPPRSDTAVRFKAPVGEAQAIRLSFGPELTWLYAYLTAGVGEVKSARLHLETKAGVETLEDTSYPFEFSFPLKAGDDILKLTVEVVNASDQTQRSETVVLGGHP
jgi:hypothetical protein